MMRAVPEPVCNWTLLVTSRNSPLTKQKNQLLLTTRNFFTRITNADKKKLQLLEFLQSWKLTFTDDGIKSKPSHFPQNRCCRSPWNFVHMPIECCADGSMPFRPKVCMTKSTSGILNKTVLKQAIVPRPYRIRIQRIWTEHVALAIPCRAQIKPVRHWHRFLAFLCLRINKHHEPWTNKRHEPCSQKSWQYLSRRAAAYIFCLTWWFASSNWATPWTVQIWCA